MILLDTNLLLRYANATDPAHPVVTAAVTTLLGKGETLCIVPQNLYEFWVVATRPLASNGLGLSVVECQQMVTGLKAAFPLLSDSPAIFPEWEALVVAYDCKGKVAHDARLVAAMRVHGITHILTFNGADFQRFIGITILDPAAVSAPAPPPTTP